MHNVTYRFSEIRIIVNGTYVHGVIINIIFTDFLQ